MITKKKLFISSIYKSLIIQYEPLPIPQNTPLYELEFVGMKRSLKVDESFVLNVSS